MQMQAASAPPQFRFALTDEEVQLTAQARYFLYSRMVVSKANFEDPAWIELCSTLVKGRFFKITLPRLDEYVDAEFKILQKCISLVFEQNCTLIIFS